MQDEIKGGGHELHTMNSTPFSSHLSTASFVYPSLLVEFHSIRATSSL